MNKWIGKGRLGKDPDVRYTSGDNAMAIARYSIGISRKVKQGQEPATDWISCVAFGKAAEFAEKYLHKGMEILVEGRILTGSYTNKDGVKVYTTEIAVENQEFCGPKADSGNTATPAATTNEGGFMNIPDNIDEELPFN